MKRLFLSLFVTLSMSYTCGLCGYSIKPKEDQIVIKLKK